MPLPIFCLPLTPAYPPWISYQAMIHIELCMKCFNFPSVSIDIVFVHAVWGKFCKICEKETVYPCLHEINCLFLFSQSIYEQCANSEAELPHARAVAYVKKQKASAENKFPPRLSAFCRTARSQITTILK